MAVVECMEAYQQGQKLRKAKIKVELQHGAECLHIGRRKESLFPNMRVRHGVHIRFCSIENDHSLHSSFELSSHYHNK